jgi:hypothetical protein
VLGQAGLCLLLNSVTRFELVQAGGKDYSSQANQEALLNCERQ